MTKYSDYQRGYLAGAKAAALAAENLVKHLDPDLLMPGDITSYTSALNLFKDEIGRLVELNIALVESVEKPATPFNIADPRCPKCNEEMVKTKSSWGNDIIVCVVCNAMVELKPMSEWLKEKG